MGHNNIIPHVILQIMKVEVKERHADMAPCVFKIAVSNNRKPDFGKWQAQQNLNPAIEFCPKHKKKDKEEKESDGKDGKSEVLCDLKFHPTFPVPIQNL